MDNQILNLENNNVLQMDKMDRNRLAQAIVTQVADGNMSSLEVLQSIKAWEDVFEKIQKSAVFYEDLLDSVNKHGKSATLNGNTLQQSEAGVKYDYTNCGHPEYNRLLAERNAIDARMKGIEAYLKGIAPRTAWIDPETGEACELYPPLRFSKTIVKVTLK